MYVGLGLTKATHEFVMLHYFATDSAQIWDDLESMSNLTFVHATSKAAASIRSSSSPASADIYEDPESATPATQIEAEVLKVSRLPRQK